MAQSADERFIKNKTYEDFEKAAKEKGLYDTFSPHDLAAARADASYGFDALRRKEAYISSDSEEERRSLAEEQQNERMKRGFYNTVEGDGKGGYAAKSHGFMQGEQSEVSKNIKSSLDYIRQYDSTLPNGQKSRYLTLIDDMLKGLTSKRFEYDAETDPRYALAQKYASRAMDNQMAQSAALSGGYGNSYGAAAGQQAYDDYMEQAALSLEDRAYGMYRDELSDSYSLLNVLEALENREYNRAADERDYEAAAAKTARTTAVSEALTALEIGDYSKLGELGFDTSYIEKLRADEDSKNALAEALEYADIGDYSRLDALGVDTSALKSKDARAVSNAALAEALEYADIGDYSRLDALGVDTTELKRQQKTAIAADACSQIEKYITVGRPVNQIPSELIEASGYDKAFWQAYAEYVENKNNA